MKRNLFFVVLFCPVFLFAQNYVHQVLILNEGYFDYTNNQIIEPVTIGTYNPVSQNYTIIDTIAGARFASDLVFDDNCFYVAADNTLYKYDKNTYVLLDSQQIDGVRNLAIWNDKILITRGDYDNTTFSPIFFNSYFQVFNTSDLSFYLEIDTITGPKWATQNLTIDGDYAYVAINNAYEWGNEKGIIGVVDLNTFSYINEIDLGPNGINPDNMFQYGDDIYTINNKDWTGSSISKISLASQTSITVNLASVPTGCGTSCMRDGRINYQISSDTTLYEWDILTMPNSGTSIGFNKNFYNLSYDNTNNLLYASSTDYVSFGSINIYNLNNSLIHTFQCGISPGSIVFDVRSITGLDELSDKNYLEESTSYDLLGREITPNELNREKLYIQNGKILFYPMR